MVNNEMYPCQPWSTTVLLLKMAERLWFQNLSFQAPVNQQTQLLHAFLFDWGITYVTYCHVKQHGSHSHRRKFQKKNNAGKHNLKPYQLLLCTWERTKRCTIIIEKQKQLPNLHKLVNILLTKPNEKK